MGQCHDKYVLKEQDLKWFRENTELSEEYVKERYEHFIQNYPDGRIPKNEFINILKSAYTKGKRRSQVQAQGLEEYTFQTYDMNGDGCIDFTEFLRVMYILSDDSPQRKLELIFETF